MDAVDNLETRIAVVQMDCDLGDVPRNLARAERLVATAAGQGAGFVVLPELCTTGTFVGAALPALAEPVPGPSVERLGALAARHGVYLVAGLPAGEGVAVAPLGLRDPAWSEWRGIASYLQDRRPDLYGRLAVGEAAGHTRSA